MCEIVNLKMYGLFRGLLGITTLEPTKALESRRTPQDSTCSPEMCSPVDPSGGDSVAVQYLLVEPPLPGFHKPPRHTFHSTPSVSQPCPPQGFTTATGVAGGTERVSQPYKQTSRHHSGPVPVFHFPSSTTSCFCCPPLTHPGGHCGLTALTAQSVHPFP